MANYKRQIVELAERELEKVRRQNEEKKAKAREEVYAKVPRIKSIDQQIRRQGLATAKAVIDGRQSKEAIASFKKELALLIREKRELLKENGFPPRYMELKYSCSKCKDTGVADNRYCSCRDAIIRRLSFQFSGLDKQKLADFNQFDLDYYDKDIQERGLSAQANAAKILEYCMNYEKGNLFFFGSPGLGKTFISGCIAKKMLDAGKIVCYMSAPKMFSLLNEQTFSKTVSEQTQLQIAFLYDADYLIIDDLGTEFRTSFTDSCLFNMLNTRLIEGKNTIVNTNIGLDQLMETYSERVSSRLAGEYRAMKFFGEDIRRKKKKRKNVTAK